MNALHILNASGRALCMGKRPGTIGTEPCAKCAAANLKLQSRDRNRERREKERREMQEALQAGYLVALPSGNFALRYRLDGKVHCQSLATTDEAKAKTLATLCMRHIRRTGRPLRQELTCYADKQGGGA